jgi:hypothetical protein
MVVMVRLGVIVGATALLAFLITWRDRRRGAAARRAGEMWRSTVREEHRDARASVGGQRINPDLRWTEWYRRDHP